MEKEEKKVIHSRELYKSLEKIYDYGTDTFGEVTADSFIEEVSRQIALLNKTYYLHPESRYLTTKTKMYRNIIIGSYLILYRLKPTNVEVLVAYHSSRSVKRVRKFKRIKV